MCLTQLNAICGGCTRKEKQELKVLGKSNKIRHIYLYHVKLPKEKNNLHLNLGAGIHSRMWINSYPSKAKIFTQSFTMQLPILYA